jgi:HSP20 family molecular chaperone IbpA
MTSSSLIPVTNDQKNYLRSSNRYSINDHGQGHRTYSYEFDLIDYDPEQITVLLDSYGKLRIRAYRPPCHEFKREYDLGTSVETRLIRNTIDTYGHLRVDIDVRPRCFDISPINTNILTFDLQGYPPKSVNVRINETGLLKITAQHNDDRFEHRINREYYRQYQLPKHMNSDQVRARMDENQILIIELPQSLSRDKESWSPYYEKKPSSSSGTKPSCCCNVM